MVWRRFYPLVVPQLLVYNIPNSKSKCCVSQNESERTLEGVKGFGVVEARDSYIVARPSADCG